MNAAQHRYGKRNRHSKATNLQLIEHVIDDFMWILGNTAFSSFLQAVFNVFCKQKTPTFKKTFTILKDILPLQYG